MIKDTTECSTSASYLDASLKLDTNGKITTQFYDKQDDINFSIVNFPYLCRNIPASHAYGVYISQVISLPELKTPVSFSDRWLSVVRLSVYLPVNFFTFSTSSPEPLGQF
jgi:hypothetical protein